MSWSNSIRKAALEAMERDRRAGGHVLEPEAYLILAARARGAHRGTLPLDRLNRKPLTGGNAQ